MIKLFKFHKKFLSLILVILIFFCLFKIHQKILGYYNDSKDYKNLRTYSPISDSIIDKDYDNEKVLKDMNSDYKFWIKIDGTNIDFPVVQGNDNDFYLSHNFNKEKNFSGSIFIDSKNDINNDNNIIIYGHNMKDDSMFAEINNFKIENFFNNYKYITIFKNNLKLTFEVFSVYLVDEKKLESELKLKFSNKKDYKNYLQEQVDKSLFTRKNLDLNINNKIITLFTCSYEFKNARLILVAKEV
ncbi:class B sortase [Clostridium perfringens]|uniref:class B sortase n=1 Tax=Clostridium perfringens TaxID=1502 RepID=UPI0018E3FB3D|nr:class B sortase [Clostridium perfringens]ELC8333277.1 class B sortase [Clostridium perfringens]ELC8451623.1 class B sortase [Clostridium perfringens]MBI6030985.1 class B sortase [Clostridium perfringens]MBI6034358.1 class B sortase [Clostridium perfringens]MBI6068111.1 class B sortase [Clostridium perfringens]